MYSRQRNHIFFHATKIAVNSYRMQIDLENLKKIKITQLVDSTLTKKHAKFTNKVPK